MTRMTKLALIVVPTLLVGVSSPSPTQAQTRVFVAAQGSDANPCTFALPCRTLQHGHDAAAAGGEVDVLDPTGYGALTITKSISIQGHGFAGISASSGNAIVVTTPSIVVNLRGLLIDGVGTGANGIWLQAGATLNIQDSLIRNFANVGIFADPTSGAAALYVADTYVTANANGISILPSGSGSASGTLHRVTVENNIGGVGFGSNSSSATFTMSDSIVAGNTDAIFVGGAGSLALENCKIVNNDLGLNVNGSARLNRSTIVRNTTGFRVGAGALFSYGDNYIDDNGSNIGSLTAVMRQ